MVQFQAGFFLDALSKFLDNEEIGSISKKLLQSLFVFEADGDIRENPFSTDDSILALAQKMISFAYQRNAPLSIENYFANNLKYTRREITEDGKISFPLIQDNPIAQEAVFRHLHIIDPRIKDIKKFLDFDFKLGISKEGFEENFLFSYLPTFLGPEFVQLLEINSSFKDFFKHIPHTFKQKTKDFTEKQKELIFENIDFSLNAPYTTNKKSKNVWIEIDDQEHDNLSQKQIDDIREYLCKEVENTQTLRIPTSEFNNIRKYISLLEEIVDKNEYYNIIKKNYNRPFYKNPIEFKWTQLVLSPIAIARIEAVLINLLLNKQLDLNADSWSIAIIERDVPAAILAIDDFSAQLVQLFKLEGKKRKLPTIRLQVYNTPEFEKAHLNKANASKIKPLSEFPSQKEFDVLIDLAILERMLPISQNQESKAKNKIRIRSSHRIKTFPEVVKAPAIAFKNLNDFPRSQHTKYLALLDNREFFARNILRIEKLDEFQLSILNEGLSGNKQLAYYAENENIYSLAYLLSFLKPGAKLWLSVKHSILLAESSFFEKQMQFSPIVLKKSDTDNEKQNKLEIIASYNLHFILSSASCFSNTCSKNLTNIKSRFQYTEIFVDSAHALSDWNPQFNAKFLSGTNALRKIVDKNNFFFAISRSGQYNVLIDISKTLNIPLGSLKIQEKTYKNLKFYVNLTQVSRENLKLGYSKATINSKKQISTLHEIEEFIEQEEAQQTDNKAIIFVPNNEGICGVSDKNLNGLYDKINQKYDEFEIMQFPAAFPYESNIQSSQNNEIIKSEWNKIHNAKIIVSNIVNALTINDTAIEKIIFPFTPISIEEIQNALASLDSNSEQSEIIFNFFKENNGIFEKQDIEHMLMAKYLGMERENKITDEIFNGMQAHKISNLDFIKRLISLKYKNKVELKINNASASYLLTISLDSKIIGQLDERTWSIDVKDKTRADLLEYIKYEIKERIPEMEYLNKWFTKIFYNKPFESFLAIWDKVKNDKTQEIQIPFENEFYSQYLNILKSVNLDFYADELINKFPYWNVFKPAMEAKANKKISKEKEETLFDIFSKIRTSYHTRIILEKWIKIGFIDSYIEDINLGVFVCLFTKKEILFYKKEIKIYFSNYFSEEFINRVLPKLDDSMPELWAQFTNLLYREIQHYTDEMSYEMVRFLQIQLGEQEKKSYRNLRATNYLRAFPFRKQSNPDFNGNLLETTSNLTRRSFDTVKEYVSQIGYKKSQWFDLLLSSKELLVKKPDYWILNFLYGLAATVVFEKETQGFEAGLDQIAQAFTQLRISQRQNSKDFAEKQDFIFSKLENQNKELRDQVEPVVELAMHGHWLQQFNQKFLSGYEGTN